MTEHDPEISCLRDLRRGSVFFDVGANIGTVSRLALEHSDIDPAAVHAFEPHPGNLQQLREAGVTVVPAAVCAQPSGMTVLYGTRPDDTQDLLASLRQRELLPAIAHGMYTYLVPTITLDEYAAEHGIERVSLVKIDVEGHEAAVLRGAADLIISRKIDAFVFEHLRDWFFADGYTPTLAEISALLPGYRLYAWVGDRWAPAHFAAIAAIASMFKAIRPRVTHHRHPIGQAASP